MTYLFGLGAYFIFVAAAYLLIRGASQLSDRTDRMATSILPLARTIPAPVPNREEAADSLEPIKPAAMRGTQIITRL